MKLKTAVFITLGSAAVLVAVYEVLVRVDEKFDRMYGPQTSEPPVFRPNSGW